MPVVLQMVERPTAQPGVYVLTGFEGQYLKTFDFEAHDGTGEISFTRDPDDAKQFADIGEAFAFLKRQPDCRPIRPDGHPNRPLTATTWEVKAI